MSLGQRGGCACGSRSGDVAGGHAVGMAVQLDLTFEDSCGVFAFLSKAGDACRSAARRASFLSAQGTRGNARKGATLY